LGLIREILPERITELLFSYIDKIEEIADRFSRAIKLLNEVRVGEARAELAEAMKVQSEASRVRNEIISLLEEVRIDPGFKEDFFHLIKRLDRIVDWIKEASRELTIIPYLELPDAVRKGLEKLIDKVLEAVEDIVEAVEKMLDTEYSEAKELIEEVEKLEEEADEIDVENRGKLIELHDQFSPVTLAILVHDLNHDLEQVADACREAGDYLRALIVGWARHR